MCRFTFILLTVLFMSLVYSIRAGNQAGQQQQQDNISFRKDYTYLNTTYSFYKIHTFPRTWQEAKEQCELEGATLFYPVDEDEAKEVIAFWTRTQSPVGWVYVGISSLLVKGVFLSIDGKSIDEIYCKWAAGEPNDHAGDEDCVQFGREKGVYNDQHCNVRSPFICKKRIEDIEWDPDCGVPRTDFVYNGWLGQCYKFHTIPKTWSEAIVACNAEQSQLAIINSEEEAKCLSNLTMITKGDKVKEGLVLLGFHNRDGEGWKTIRGKDLTQSGYSTWRANKPGGGDKERCGAMSFAGELDDVECNKRFFYICERPAISFSSKNIEPTLFTYRADFSSTKSSK